MEHIISETIYAIADTSGTHFLLGAFYVVLHILLRRPSADATKNRNFSYIDKEPLTRESLTEFFFILFNKLFFLFIGGTIIAYTSGYSYQLLIPPGFAAPLISTLPMVVQVVICIFVIDFFSYFYHRFVHKFFWYYHAAHHASEKMTWITAGKLHPIDQLFYAFSNGVALYMLGASPEMLMVLSYAIAIDSFYNGFVHMNIQLEYPRYVRHIFASPNFHRWHHAKHETQAYNKNFCTIFSCIDYVFGTAYHPQGKLPSAYGITNKKFPKSFIGQCLYPIKWHITHIKKQYARLIK